MMQCLCTVGSTTTVCDDAVPLCKRITNNKTSYDMEEGEV